MFIQFDVLYILTLLKLLKFFLYLTNTQRIDVLTYMCFTLNVITIIFAEDKMVEW